MQTDENWGCNKCPGCGDHKMPKKEEKMVHTCCTAKSCNLVHECKVHALEVVVLIDDNVSVGSVSNWVKQHIVKGGRVARVQEIDKHKQRDATWHSPRGIPPSTPDHRSWSPLGTTWNACCACSLELSWRARWYVSSEAGMETSNTTDTQILQPMYSLARDKSIQNQQRAQQEWFFVHFDGTQWVSVSDSEPWKGWMGESLYARSCRVIDCVCYAWNKEIQRISSFEHPKARCGWANKRCGIQETKGLPRFQLFQRTSSVYPEDPR
jgi:hypothetical protein